MGHLGTVESFDMVTDPAATGERSGVNRPVLPEKQPWDTDVADDTDQHGSEQI